MDYTIQLMETHRTNQPTTKNKVPENFKIAVRILILKRSRDKCFG